MSTRKPYDERTDLEKVASQWHKLSGLHGREEWSAAIVRAATAAELAANFAIRKEFKARSKFESEFVDSLLVWANGLAGKIDRLLLPLSESDAKKNETFKSLKAAARAINGKRNAIAHQGEFCNDGEARKVIEQARTFIESMVRIYQPEFKLPERKTSTRRVKKRSSPVH